MTWSEVGRRALVAFSIVAMLYASVLGGIWAWMVWAWMVWA